MFSKKLREQGKRAYKDNPMLAENPYRFHPNAAKAGWWYAGWKEAEREANSNGALICT